MVDVFVARQPIFNGKLRVVGYELLFRGGRASEGFAVSAEAATATVVLNSFTEIGLERIVGPHSTWVNVSRGFVLDGLAGGVPPGLIVLEILEDQLVDASLVAAVGELKRQGYRLALDDFAYSPGIEPLLGLAEVVKLDVLALGRERLAEQVALLKAFGVTLLAAKVETHEDHAYCAALGCDLFQGFFFCKPELVHGQGINASRLSLLELVAALQDPDVQLARLERLIARDVALSFRLLRYINSAFLGLRKVGSIRQALALLGLENLKRWATLTVFASVEGKPPELTVTALIRARFCERAGEQLSGASPAELFTLGLFSVIDAVMDAPIADVVGSIPFPEHVCEALIARRGALGRLLECVTAAETGDSDRAHAIIGNATELYLESVMWANAAAAPLFEQTGRRGRDAFAASC